MRLQPGALFMVLALGLALGGCNSSSSNSPNPGPNRRRRLRRLSRRRRLLPRPPLRPSRLPPLRLRLHPKLTACGCRISSGLLSTNSIRRRAPSAATRLPNFPTKASSASAPGLAFDSSQNLWVTNCSDFTLATGSFAEFTAAQLALGNDSAPTPNTTLLDDGSLTILNCPWGEQFDAAGNLWIINRSLPTW